MTLAPGSECDTLSVMYQKQPKDRRSVTLLVRVTPGEAAALDARAHAEKSSRSIVLRAALAAYLARKPRRPEGKGGSDA